MQVVRYIVWCGHQDKRMKDINKREYVCCESWNKLERDINASLNLVYEGILHQL